MGKITLGATGMSYQYNKVKVNTETPKCPRCGDRVYFNEEVRTLGKPWHKRCFNCAECKSPLDSARVNNHEDEIFCNNCHKKKFGPRGYGFAGGAAGLASDVIDIDRRASLSTITVPQHAPSTGADPNDTRNCPRCGKRVYFAEEVKALSRNWHRLCFKCGTCNKLLQPGSCSEHNETPYCQQCYQRKLGIQGYGFGVGAGILQSEAERSPRRAYTSPARRRSSDGRRIDVISAQENLPSTSPTTAQWTESVYV